MRRLVVAVGLAMVLAWPALAQQGSSPPESPAPGNPAPWSSILIDPSAWIRSMEELLAVTYIDRFILELSWLVVLLGIVWGGIRVSQVGSSEAYGLLTRLMMSSFVIGLSTYRLGGQTLGDRLLETWNMAYRLGNEALMSTVDVVLEALVTLATMMPVVGPSLTAFARLGGTGIKAALAAGGELMTKGTNMLGTVAQWTGSLAAFELLGLAGAYSAFLVLSASIMVIGLVLLPLAGAMLIWPGSMGREWISMWFRGTVASIITAFFLPVIFAGALQVSVVLPKAAIENAWHAAADAVADATGEVTNNIQQIAQPQGGSWWERFTSIVTSVDDVLLSTWNVVQSAIQGIVLVMVGLVLSVLLGIGSLFAGVMLLYNVERYVASFIGGISSSVGDVAGRVRWLGLASMLGSGTPAGAAAAATAGGGSGGAGAAPLGGGAAAPVAGLSAGPGSPALPAAATAVASPPPPPPPPTTAIVTAAPPPPGYVPQWELRRGPDGHYVMTGMRGWVNPQREANYVLLD